MCAKATLKEEQTLGRDSVPHQNCFVMTRRYSKHSTTCCVSFAIWAASSLCKMGRTASTCLIKSLGRYFHTHPLISLHHFELENFRTKTPLFPLSLGKPTAPRAHVRSKGRTGMPGHPNSFNHITDFLCVNFWRILLKHGKIFTAKEVRPSPA